MAACITPKEYAALHGITLQAVTYRIRKGLPLPGIKEVQQWGRFYLLVPE